MKKIRIVNVDKFIRSISITILVIIGIIFLLSNVSFSHNEKEHINYDKVIITKGDTLWQIAIDQQENNPYYKNKDVREIIQNIQKINELNSSNLLIGQELKVPVI